MHRVTFTVLIVLLSITLCVGLLIGDYMGGKRGEEKCWAACPIKLNLPSEWYQNRDIEGNIAYVDQNHKFRVYILAGKK